MHIILTGATGLVGSAALSALLRDKTITRITVFSRNPVPQATDSPFASKCTVIAHVDFSFPPPCSTLVPLAPAQGCIWALGISQTEVDARTYTRITREWPLAWARAFADAKLGGIGAEKLFNFVYVSGEGATTSPGFMTPMFGRVKGETEIALLQLMKEERMALGGLRVFNARCGGVDYLGHEEIIKYSKPRRGIMKKVEVLLIGVLRNTVPNFVISTFALGEALAKLACGDGKRLQGEGFDGEGQGRVFGNVVLRRLAGL